MLINNIISINGRINASAKIKGSTDYPEINGTVQFFRQKGGVLVYADIWGLPKESSFYGFHIHEGTLCDGNNDDPFALALTHYNPLDRPHPYHAGDLPPLLSSGGHAISVVLTNRFTLSEVLSKVIIIHSSPDDFTTQPSGNSGEKIACGVIISTKK